jgi:HEAT repeat protein
MMKITDGSYASYRESSPFLFPIPDWLNRILTWPGRLVTGGGYPTKGRQVVWIVLIYTVILMALSLIWMDLGGSGRNVESAEQTREELSEIHAKLDRAGDNRRVIYGLMEQIPEHGEAGQRSLMTLADNQNPAIREFSVMFLGQMKVQEAEDIIVRSMYDSIKRVRSSAIVAAGDIKSQIASDSLSSMLVHPVMDNNLFLIYGALGSIGNKAAMPALAEGLKDGPWYNQIAALSAIRTIDPGAGLSHAISELQDEQVEVRRNAVIACIRSGSKQAIEPLRSKLGDEDFEVRFYARQGIKKLEAEGSL